MSSPSAGSATALTPPSPFLHSLSALSHGYAIAIALAILVLLSALLLASYLCYRSRTSALPPDPPAIPSDAASTSGGGVMLPRIIFVAEDDDEEPGGGSEQSPVPGLDPAAISSYPKFPFIAGKGGDAACAICLCEYRDGEMLRMLPDCRHYFHLMCIDAWLRLNASCPVCRTSPMPTPLSTPLSELVPLSQFPAGRRRRA